MVGETSVSSFCILKLWCNCFLCSLVLPVSLLGSSGRYQPTQEGYLQPRTRQHSIAELSSLLWRSEGGNRGKGPALDLELKERMESLVGKSGSGHRRVERVIICTRWVCTVTALRSFQSTLHDFHSTSSDLILSLSLLHCLSQTEGSESTQPTKSGKRSGMLIAN